jgi:SAM-dependent methyltransferase
MEQNNPYARMDRATAGERAKVYAEIYDSVPGAVVATGDPRAPSARRRKRLSLYARIIGPGHQAILEIGCASGDLTCVLASQTRRVVGVDMSGASLHLAAQRARRLPADLARRVQLVKMNAVSLEFIQEAFDYAVSTSMIEHLHPDDVGTHLRQVWRVLKPGGSYLVWCPNRLGHHKHRPDHLSMMSHGELVEKMRLAGFVEFRSPLFTRPPMVSAGFKIGLERTLVRLHVGVLWSHLGVRNVLLVARKGTA